MDDDVLLLPLDSPDRSDSDPVPALPAGASRWWPVVAVVAAVVALFALIRDDGEPRAVEAPEVTDPLVVEPVSTEAAIVAPPVDEPTGPVFDAPLFGRVWNSELVVVDGDVVTFVDLAKAEFRTADLSHDVIPPVAFYEQSFVFSDGLDLVRLTPGFAYLRYLRHDARDVRPLPGLPLAFHGADSETLPEIIVVGPTNGATTWLKPGVHPWAMWNGTVLVNHENRIEILHLDGSEPTALAEGTILAASGDAVLYESCTAAPETSGDADPAEVTGDERPAPSPISVAGCGVMLLRRDGSITTGVDLPDNVQAVSLSPRGNHVIYVVEIEEGSRTSVVFVAPSDGISEAVSVATIDAPDDDVWPAPMWAQDGRAAIVSSGAGAKLIDLDSGGALDVTQVIGDLEGEIVGFVSIRHEAGTTSPAEPA